MRRSSGRVDVLVDEEEFLNFLKTISDALRLVQENHVNLEPSQVETLNDLICLHLQRYSEVLKGLEEGSERKDQSEEMEEEMGSEEKEHEHEPNGSEVKREAEIEGIDGEYSKDVREPVDKPKELNEATKNNQESSQGEPSLKSLENLDPNVIENLPNEPKNSVQAVHFQKPSNYFNIYSNLMSK